jgi:uncharacterized phage protein (TIGR02218 family)
MKQRSYKYEAHEEGRTKKPAELYHVWFGSTHWRYTNGDVAVTYNGNVYSRADISRGVVSFDSTLEVRKLDVIFARSSRPMPEFIAQNPAEPLWIEILRLHREQSPYEAGVIFIGQISNVAFKGLDGMAECVGFESYLRQPIPVYRYQPECNWEVFSARCKLSDTAYKIDAVLTDLSADGLELTSAAFGTKDDHYFRFGKAVFNGHSRLITYHVGEIIKIRYSIPYLAIGSTVETTAGCDGDIETCRDKFNNVVNFGGHPYIPLDNPVLWSGN